MPVSAAIRVSKNEQRIKSEKFRVMMEIAKNDDACVKLASRLNAELLKSNPDKETLKHLRDLYRNAFDDAKDRYIKSVESQYS